MTDHWHVISANDHLAYAQPVDWCFVTDGEHTIAGPLRHAAAVALCAKHNAVVDKLTAREANT